MRALLQKLHSPVLARVLANHRFAGLESRSYVETKIADSTLCYLLCVRDSEPKRAPFCRNSLLCFGARSSESLIRGARIEIVRRNKNSRQHFVLSAMRKGFRTQTRAHLQKLHSLVLARVLANHRFAGLESISYTITKYGNHASMVPIFWHGVRDSNPRPFGS